MYNGYGTYNSPPPELSNNPFLEQSPLNRFPDIQPTDPNNTNTQFTPWQTQQQPSQPTSMQYGFNAQPQQQPFQQQQYTAAWNPQPQSPGGQPQFQPSSSFGQQLSNHINGTGGTYANPGAGTEMQQQFVGYPQPQSYAQTGYQNYGGGMGMPQQGYIAELDPYAPIGQGWDGGSQSTSTQQQTQQSTNYPSKQDHLHPREFIRKYKAELETWDSYTWKQMQNVFDALKDSWEKRMREIEGKLKLISPNWGMAAQQDMMAGQQLLKDAEAHFSSVAASSFQIKEILQGYRQSSDMASKRRVREAMNAALQNLPDWPSPNY